MLHEALQATIARQDLGDRALPLKQDKNKELDF